MQQMKKEPNLDDLLSSVEQIDLVKLREKSINEPDTAKKAVWIALFEYKLAKQWKKVVERPDFIR